MKEVEEEEEEEEESYISEDHKSFEGNEIEESVFNFWLNCFVIDFLLPPSLH